MKKNSSWILAIFPNGGFVRQPLFHLKSETHVNQFADEQVERSAQAMKVFAVISVAIYFAFKLLGYLGHP